MTIDLHNHTVLCNHATGTVDDYIEAAIAAGTHYFGFSDHAPMRFDPEYRMSISQMGLYERWIREAQEKYADRITILLGYEVDFLPNYMEPSVLNRPCDYRIGSVHFIDQWGFDNPDYFHRYQELESDEMYIRYFNLIEEMAKSGRFDIVGHLDLLKVFKFFPKTDVRILAKNALLAIKKANMTIEINVAGLRKPVEEIYPSPSLLASIAELEIPITFGSDAHRPDQVGLFTHEAQTLASSVGYEYGATYCNRDRAMVKF